MNNYSVVISPGAQSDIRNSIHYYNQQQVGVGEKFLNDLSEDFCILGLNPYFEIRYAKVRCLPMKRFPFLIHFLIIENKKIVRVEAVIHTAMNPKWLQTEK